MLQARSLIKGYRQASSVIPVLRGLDLNVATGEAVAIVGRSGCGKSTLLSLLAALDRPDAGSVEIDGELISQMSETQATRFRAKKIGIIFQQFHLVPYLTALENVELPLEILGETKSRARAEEWLERVGLTPRSHHLPAALSGGECQRVALARALIARPKLLLADEPSGNLDGATAEEVTALLFSLVRETHLSVVLVTHSTDLASRCERRLALRDGTLHALP